MKIAAEDRDYEMFKNPLRWPQWPWLHLKRTENHMNRSDGFGIMHADRPRKVYLKNLTGQISPVPLEYDTWEEMGEDWRVD